MWNPRTGRGGASVTCIACGETLSREDAREYDKEGDRWDRRGKDFEYLCKPCDRRLCHQPRDGLEALLTEAEAGETDRNTFLSQFVELAEEREPADEQ
ncbi:MAG: hypothetical protein ABEI96_08070 [Haloarculaceae archaeon]